MIDAVNVGHRLREAAVEIAILDEKRISRLDSSRQGEERAKAAYSNWIDYSAVISDMTTDPFTKIRYPVQTMVEIDYYDEAALKSYADRRDAAIENAFVFVVGIPPGEVAQYIKPAEKEQSYLLVYPGRTQTEYGVSDQLPQQVPPFGPIPHQSAEHTVFVTAVVPEISVCKSYNLSKGEFESSDILVQDSDYGMAAVYKTQPVVRNIYNALINWVAGPCISNLRLRSGYPLGFYNGNYIYIMEWYASEIMEVPADGLVLTRPSDAEEYDYDDVFKNRNYLKTYDILTIWNRSQQVDPNTGETTYVPIDEDTDPVDINFKNPVDTPGFDDALRGPNIDVKFKDVEIVYVQFSTDAASWRNSWETNSEYVRFRVEDAVNWSTAYKFAGDNPFIALEFSSKMNNDSFNSATDHWSDAYQWNTVYSSSDDLVRIRQIARIGDEPNDWYVRRLPEDEPARLLDNLDLTNPADADGFVFPENIPGVTNFRANNAEKEVAWAWPATQIDGIVITISNLDTSTVNTVRIGYAEDSKASFSSYPNGTYQVFGRTYIRKGRYNLLSENTLTAILTLR